MKIYIINLKHRLDRKQFMLDQFDKYGITDYEFVEAIDGSILDIKKTGYDDAKARSMFRSMSIREIACVLSHIEVYKRIIQSGERAIILEDDCVLSKEIAEFIKIHIPENLDLVMLGHRSSNIEDPSHKSKCFKYDILSRQPCPDGRLTRTYFKNEKFSIGSIDLHEIDEQSYKVDFLFSAHAYSPSLHMCKMFIAFNSKPKVPADVIWSVIHDYGLNIRIWGVVTPIGTIENDRLGSDIDIDRESLIISTYENNEISYMQRLLSEEFDT